MWSHGSFYWNELMTRDVEQAKRFYSSSIGWTFEAVPMPNGTYWLAKMDDKSVAGIFPLSGPEFDAVENGNMNNHAIGLGEGTLISHASPKGAIPLAKIGLAADIKKRRGRGDGRRSRHLLQLLALASARAETPCTRRK